MNEWDLSNRCISSTITIFVADFLWMYVSTYPSSKRIDLISTIRWRYHDVLFWFSSSTYFLYYWWWQSLNIRHMMTLQGLLIILSLRTNRMDLRMIFIPKALKEDTFSETCSVFHEFYFFFNFVTILFEWTSSSLFVNRIIHDQSCSYTDLSSHSDFFIYELSERRFMNMYKRSNT